MRAELAAALCRDGYLFPTAARGVYGLDGRFTGLLEAVSSAVSALAAGAGAAVVRYPPVIAADDLHRVGYPRSFPHLAGVVSVWPEGAAQDRAVAALYRGTPWAERAGPSELAPCPAACYPVYSRLAGREVAASEVYDVMGHCFRREPSDDPFRMQCFRMHEIVCVGDRAAIEEFLERAHHYAGLLFADLGLAATPAAATDPFFGSGGRVLAREQRERGLKTEYLCPSPDGGVAMASVNSHEAHFTRPHGIGAGGEPAASACIGFGLERIVLAAFLQHGPDPAAWPDGTRRAFGLAEGT